MGLDAKEKVSSSMPDNMHELKIKTVETRLKASGRDRSFGIKAICCIKDCMVPAFAGLAAGAANKGITITQFKFLNIRIKQLPLEKLERLHRCFPMLFAVSLKLHLS